MRILPVCLHLLIKILVKAKLKIITFYTGIMYLTFGVNRTSILEICVKMFLFLWSHTLCDAVAHLQLFNVIIACCSSILPQNTVLTSKKQKTFGVGLFGTGTMRQSCFLFFSLTSETIRVSAKDSDLNLNIRQFVVCGRLNGSKSLIVYHRSDGYRLKHKHLYWSSEESVLRLLFFAHHWNPV